MSKGLVAALLVVAAAACSGPPPVDTPPRTVLTRDLGDAVALPSGDVYTGEVRARVQHDVAFRVGGKLVERRVDTGAMVRRGDVLARLDPRDVELAANAAAARLAAAQADRELARAEMARSGTLHAAGFISASALDARRNALAAADAHVRQARAQAAVAGNQAGYAELVADTDAVVVAAAAEAGQVVAAGQPVLRLARPDEREVLIHVPERRIAAFAPGQAARVRPWAQPAREYAAVVREIAPAADPATRSYALRVSVPEADAALPLGATAKVMFAGATAAQTLLPLSAVTAIAGRPTVWIVDADARVRPVVVDIGAMREDGVVILAGLPAGARVVLAGVHQLVEGERVRAIGDGAPVALDAGR